MTSSPPSAAPVVLITGALTGIGRATAIAYARAGARLVVSGRRDEAGQALAAELRGLGAQAEYLRADVRREADVRALVEQTVERFGRLDIAVNNAGTEGELGPLTEQTTENYASTFDTNVLGVLLSLTVSDLASFYERLSGVALFDAYFVNYLPSHLKGSDVLWVSCTAFGLSFLATLYPARQAGRIQPAEALRHE